MELEVVEYIFLCISKQKVAEAMPQSETQMLLLVRKEHAEMVPDVIDLLTNENDDSSLNHIHAGSVDTDIHFEVDVVSRALQKIITEH